MTTNAYDINDATLEEIRELVNRSELENSLVRGTSTFEGDGTTTQWYCAIPGWYIYPETFSVTVDGVAKDYTLDAESGIVTMTDTPADGAIGVCTFNSRQFPDFQVDAAINAAVRMLFPKIYRAGTELLTCDGDTYEFELPGSVEVITSIDYRSDASGGWSRQARTRRYTVYPEGNAQVVRFYTAPSSGQLRVHTVSRPGTFTYEGQPLSSLGLSPHHVGPIIAGAVYRLLMSKAALRVRTDVAVATMGTGTVFPSMMSQVAGNWLMRFQFELTGVRMRPWIIR